MWIVVLSSTLPWLAGGIALNLIYAIGSQKVRNPALLYGVGGLLGTIGMALVTIAATWIGVNLISLWAIVALGLVCVSGAAGLYKLRPTPEAAPRAPAREWGFTLLISLALVILFAGINAWQVLWMPAVGWDTLWSWAEISKSFINTTQADPTPAWVHDQTHPSTVAVIAASATAYIPTSGGVGPVYFSWWLVWLSVLLIIFGYTDAVTKNINASALATVVSASIPLMTNHVILGGYAELFLAAATVGATATLVLSLKEQDEKLALLGLLVALSCATLKNTGFVFSSCIFIGYTTCLAISRGFGKWVILFATVMGVSGALFILTLPSQSMTFEMGNRQLILELGNAHLIPRNELISLFYNSSFSIIALLLLAPVITFGAPDWKRSDKEVSSFFMPWLTSVIILGMLCASQLTDYGFLYATPTNDTGNSRFSLPFVVCALLVIGPLWNAIVNHDRKVATQ